MRFCVQCGTAREGSAPYCTGCGEAFPPTVADEAPSHTTASPRVAPTVPRPSGAAPRQLRCVACGSAIEMGLTCAACSRGSASATSAPKDAPPRPAAESGPASGAPATKAVPPTRDSSPSGRWVGALTTVGLVLAAGIGHWANQHPGDASRAFAQVSPFGSGLDGVYDCSNGAITATLTVSGSTMSVEIPSLLQIKGSSFERHGATLTIRGGVQYDGNGYLVDASDDGRSVLATVGDDGQSITLRFDSMDMRFVRR